MHQQSVQHLVVASVVAGSQDIDQPLMAGDRRQRRLLGGPSTQNLIEPGHDAGLPELDLQHRQRAVRSGSTGHDAGSFARVTRTEPASEQVVALFLARDLAPTGEQASIHTDGGRLALGKTGTTNRSPITWSFLSVVTASRRSHICTDRCNVERPNPRGRS
jgi:hypothetical protein